MPGAGCGISSRIIDILRFNGAFSAIAIAANMLVTPDVRNLLSAMTFFGYWLCCGILLFLLPFLLFVNTVWLIPLLLRERHQRLLVRDGIAVLGVVEQVYPGSANATATPLLKYRFEARGHGLFRCHAAASPIERTLPPLFQLKRLLEYAFSGGAATRSTVFDNLREGDSVLILYLPHNPRVNAPYRALTFAATE